jgi:tetratricopeptide (TPR) repeat protein
MKRLTKISAVVLVALFLTACSSKYNVKVNLTPEEENNIKAEISEFKKQIAAHDTSDGTIAWAQIIETAKDYEKLGDLKSAINLYKSWLDKGYKTKGIINNLGRLYEKVGEVELAVTQYRRLIEEYQDDSYLYDITWAYINAKQRKEAEKYFNLWQLKFQKTDEQTQLAIKGLRAEEEAAKEK